MTSDQDRWIPVSERLPEEWRDVLAGCSTCCLIFHREGPYWVSSESGHTMVGNDDWITHWRELPDLPPEMDA